MGNAESSGAGIDKPEPLMEEAARNLSMQFYGAAVKKYRRAYELLNEAGSKASAARALRLAAEAGLCDVGPDYELAVQAFEEVGMLYLENPLTALSAPQAFANAVFCLLAAGRGKTATAKVEEFGKLPKLKWGDEGIAVTCILDSYNAGHRNQTKDLSLCYCERLGGSTKWRETIFNRIVERLS